MPLAIQIVSDMHVEFRESSSKNYSNYIKPAAPILALLGDTCCVASEADFKLYKKFINDLLPKFQHIILIPGNHEYYYKENAGSNITEKNTLRACNTKLAAFANSSPKLHYLNKRTFNVAVGRKVYSIIGCVLWTWIPTKERTEAAGRMNDYGNIYMSDSKTKSIRKLTPDDVSRIHTSHKKYIKTQLAKAKKNGRIAIVLTHHKPYVSKTGPVKYTYESDLSDLFASPLAIWCYGHTHKKDNKVIKGVRFVSNPKGYPRQQTKFNGSCVITV